METILKYPRTRHLQGSRLQTGDEDLSQVQLADIAGRYIVIEEKLDGANSGISFNPENLEMLLQSRGHYLTGGYRERHFNLFKQWASCHEAGLMELLNDRYIMYGEWMYAKHTVFYDALPHYFLEFDLWDRSTQTFLSTAARNRVLSCQPVVSVPVLYEGPCPSRIEDLTDLIKPSLAKSANWKNSMARTADMMERDWIEIEQETSTSDLAEGLYIKIEEGDATVDRLKWVRVDFLQAIEESETHWVDRPIFPNGLRRYTDIYSPESLREIQW